LVDGDQFSAQQVREKIVCDLLASERDYVKLLQNIVEVQTYIITDNCFD